MAKGGKQHDAAELFEPAVSFCISDKKRAAELSRRLLNRFGSIPGVLRGSPAELCMDSLLSPQEAAKIKLIGAMFLLNEIKKLGSTINADNESSVKEYLRLLYMTCSEETVYLFPISGGKLNDPHRLSSGGEISVRLDPEKLVSILRCYADCTEFIISHNHPTDICTPSKSDISVTERVFGYAYSCGYDLKAHYIVGRDGVGSVPFSRNYVSYFFGGG